ncbi:MAG TPA: fatty acyl CoA synthetase [Xanthomonadaceae bacterium]|nr:fatty acyl CoA synthetase [Xanthomonadaceae bacterium]
MRAGIQATTAAALLALATAAKAEDGAALDALLAPASTAFLERRDSPLLEAPLLLRGTLHQPDAETLLREVESPFHERTTIRAERVVIERADGRERRFALRNAPELAALLDSFRALLGGDRALLERHYRVRLDSTADGTWRIDLVPREARRQRRIARVELIGRDDALACLVVHAGDGGVSRMLLGAAAETTLDDALDSALATHCDTESVPE